MTGMEAIQVDLFVMIVYILENNKEILNRACIILIGTVICLKIQ